MLGELYCNLWWVLLFTFEVLFEMELVQHNVLDGGPAFFWERVTPTLL
jgi:hypothetical protein